MALALAACAPGVDLGYTDNSIHSGHYADASARKHRTNRVDTRLFAVPKQLTADVVKDPVNHLQRLVDFLMTGAADDYVKAKRIHDWIALHVVYDVAASEAGKYPSQDPATVVSTKRAVCEGYAVLFRTMATMAGLETYTVDGFSKGGAQYLEDGQLSTHAWNAVRVGQRWYLLDVTRDAGVTSGGAFKRRYSTRYLFLAPTAFVHFNLPLDRGFQMLDRPLSPAQFQSLPYLNGDFFQHRLRLTSRPVGSLVKVVNNLILDVEAPAGVFLVARVRAGASDVSHAAFGQRWGGTYRVLLQPPKVGTYQVRLHARGPSDAAYHLVGAFNIRKTSNSPSARPFPVASSSFVERNAHLVSPMDGELLKNLKRYFRVTVPGATQVYIHGSPTQQLATLSCGKGDEFTGFFKVPAGVAEINVAADLPGVKGLSLLLKYRVK